MNEQFAEAWDGYINNHGYGFPLYSPYSTLCDTSEGGGLAYNPPIWYCVYCKRPTKLPVSECIGCGAVEFNRT